MAEIPKYQFRSVQLLKDQSLGIGSYGAVCKAKCDDLFCAAKIIHPTLFDPTALQQIAPQREHRLPIRRFEQECEFMSAIRHPNIVQYLGMFRDADTHLPVLLMELMDDSLTHFLESSKQPISYHIQVNICHDVTLALSFLHSNNIVHRDLSSNNILLRGSVLAKVTDFGMARLSDINPQATCFTNTMCPGTDVYMPPEAVQDEPVYTEKIDCFSFGAITIQILTRQFPKPGKRLQAVDFNHPGLPKGTLMISVPEIERRQNHISQVDPNHALLPIALDCLKDKDSERPSAHRLCERVADLKRMPNYTGSIQENNHSAVIQSLKCTISSKDKEIQQHRQQIQVSAQANRLSEEKLEQLHQQLRQLQLQNNQKSRENTRKMTEKERQLGRVNQQLEASEKVVAQFERRIAELEQLLSQREQQKTKASDRGKEQTSFKLKWNEGNNPDCVMRRTCDAVVDGNTVYTITGMTGDIHAFDVTNDSWSEVPGCTGGSTITVVNGWLTAIGGYSDYWHHLYSSELLSLTGEGSDRRWMEKFPPMPTKRSNVIALCFGNKLIVAGGEISKEAMKIRIPLMLSTVEVMDTETHQWSTAADLRQPISCASAAVSGNQLYLLGGHAGFKSPNSVYTCSLSGLLQSVESSSDASIWSQVADLPYPSSTCEFFNGRLLAIGGVVDSEKASTAIYMYNSTTNSWDIISHMTTGRYDCLTAVLPGNRLMVVGGLGGDGIWLDTVEFASVCD